MIEDVVSGWLYARSTNLTDLVRADLTLVLPTKSGLRVYAEMMITSFSQGGDLDKHVGGSVATRVVRATVMGKNGIEYIDLPADLTNNSAFFDNCLAVDFRLGCLLAEAYANANVWYHSKPAKKPTVLIRKDIVISDRKTGAWRYSKSFVGPGKRLPSDEMASHLALEQAAELLGMRTSALVAKQRKRPPVIEEREGASAKRSGVFRSTLLRI